MRRLILFILIAFSVAFPLASQAAPAGAPLWQADEPDYAIRPSGGAELSQDGRTLTLRFVVRNDGAAAPQTGESTVYLTILQTGRRVGIQTIPPLPAGGTRTVEFAIPTSELSPGSSVSFQASVGINEIEAAGSDTAGNNVATVGADIPANLPTGTAPQQTPGAGANATPLPGTTPAPGATAVATPRGIAIPGLDSIPALRNFRLDITNPVHVAGLIAVGGILLVLLWVVTVILRLLFSKEPTLGVWQPPYANMPLSDPNTVAGRRQLWQQHARADALPDACTEGHYQIRKRLLGMGPQGDVPLSGWRVSAIGISQYDMYGRVARSQTLAPNGTVRTLDRLARRAHRLDPTKIARNARPVANVLVSQFGKKLTQRNAMLPVAVDLRFRGVHGEVRIVFELFQCSGGSWQKIDEWEPEMTVRSGSIHENYTYTFFGQRPGEKTREYRLRLREELVRNLVDMLKRPPVAAPPPLVNAPPTQPGGTPPVPQEILQDTAAHPPVSG
jgi:hypothetical protein